VRKKYERTGLKDADGKPIVVGQYCIAMYKEPTGEMVNVNGEIAGRFPQNLVSVFLPDVGRRGVYKVVDPSDMHMFRSKKELVGMSKKAQFKWYK